MKPKALAAALLILMAHPLVAQNTAQNWPLESPVYHLIDILALETGQNHLLNTRPATTAELKMALVHLDTAKLSPQGDRLYQEISTYINNRGLPDKEVLSYLFNHSLNLESYYQTEGSRLLHQYTDFAQRPLYSLGMEFAGTPRTYFNVGLDIEYDPLYQKSDKSLPVNVILNPYVHLQVPNRAFFSYGGEHWNFSGGRNQLEWGTAPMGNFMISDSAPYREYLQFHSPWDRVKFSFLWMNIEPVVYDQQGNRSSYEELLYLEGGTTINPEMTNLSSKWDERVLEFQLYKGFYAHRLDLKLLDNLTFSISESIVQANQYPTLGDLNPFMIFHALYQDRFIRYANNLGIIELVWKPLPGWEFFGQMASDQYALEYEKSNWPDANEPDALARIAGFKTAHPLGGGYLMSHFQYTQTDPYFYLEKYPLMSYTQTNSVVSLYQPESGGTLQIHPLGYHLGNDVLSYYGEFKFIKPFDFTGTLGVGYYEKGELTLTDFLEYSPEAVKLDTPTGTPEKVLHLKVAWDQNLLPGLRGGVEGTFFYTRNYNHDIKKSRNDIMINMYMNYSF